MHNLNYIESFLMVVETNSFTRAAKARNISKAAASKHISQLENELGFDLLVRSTREIALTPEGQLVYEECRRIIDNVNELESMLSGLKKEPSGTLSVVSGPVFAYKYIIPNLAQFIKKFPKINLKLSFRHLMPNMLEEKIDIVVGVFGTPPPDAIQRTVIQTRRLLCASPEYLKQHGTPKTPKDLLSHPVIIHPIQPNDIHLKVGSQLITPRAIMNDQLAIKRCVLDNMGIGFLQHHVVEQELREGMLIEVLKKSMDQKLAIPINLYYLQARHLHSKIRVFIDFILEAVKF